MQRNTIRFIGTVTTGVVLASLAATQSDAYWGDGCNGTYNGYAQPNSCARDCCNYIETGRQINSMWPYPYVCPDRQRAMAPFDVMVSNGWRRQNLLGAHHFDRETGKLTRAGELKVEWILTQTPPNRRQIFVERSMDMNVTDDRIAQAQQFASNIPFEEGETVVQHTHVRSPRRPAGMVDLEHNSFKESRPPAVLPTGSKSVSSSSN